MAGFESTHLPGYRTDLFEVTGHCQRWQDDLDDLLGVGVRHLRYPLRWPQIQPEPGRFDWSEADRVLEHLRDAGAVPIIDLVHHTSYPDWLRDGFRDREFGPALVRYAEAVADRYPWLPAYTLFNEPFATLYLAGHEALWPPYDRGHGRLRPALPARCCRRSAEPPQSGAELLPDAHHVWVDTAEHHAGARRRPGLRRVRQRPAAHLPRPGAGARPGPGPAVPRRVHPSRRRSRCWSCRRDGSTSLGLDYYCHSEWYYDEVGGHAPSPHPIGFAAVAEQYHEPLRPADDADRDQPPRPALGPDLAGCATCSSSTSIALERGVPLHGFCWFPQVDSCDWDSLLARTAGRVDPVGVLSIDGDTQEPRADRSSPRRGRRRCSGSGAEDLPAYRFQPPCDTQLAGLLAGLDALALGRPSRRSGDRRRRRSAAPDQR